MIDRKIKNEVFVRDNFRCKSCGEDKNLTLDHIIPVDQGGNDTIENLQTLCLACNHRKGNYLELNFWQKLKFIWNVDLRINSNTRMLASQFKQELKLRASAQEVKKEFTDIRNTFNGNLINERKQNAIKTAYLENLLTQQDKQIKEIEKVFNDLLDFMNIVYTPKGFKELKNKDD